MRVLNKVTGKSKAVISISLAFALMLAGCAGSDSTNVKAEMEPEASVSVEENENADTEDNEIISEEKETQKVKNGDLVDGIYYFSTFDMKKPDNDAIAFTDKMGAGWSLGNTFDSISEGVAVEDLKHETYWGNPKTTEQNIIDLKEAGFSTIRIPVSWHNHVDGNFVISEAWLNRVKEVVDYAISADMYVILNIHHDNEKGFMYPSYEEIERSKKYVETIWTQLATTFGDYDEHLIFETLNEPRMKDTDAEWWVDQYSDLGKEAMDCVNILNQTAVTAIRSTEGEYNKERFIMCPTYCANPDFIDSFVMPDDSLATKENRILLSIHAYRPYGFALAPDDHPDVTDVFENDSKSKKDIDDFMSKVYSKFISKGIGTVIGEFGACNRNGNIESRSLFAAYFASQAKMHGFSYVWWDNGIFTEPGEKFGIYDRRNNEFKYPEIANNLVYYSNKTE